MDSNLNDLIVIGAGASGLMAAQAAAAAGLQVLVLEGKSSAGAKILMSGGGRCNVTNTSVTEKDFGSDAPRLVKHVLEHFKPAAAVSFFERNGVTLKLEEDGKYFSASDQARDVLTALQNAVRTAGATIEYNSLVREICFAGGHFETSGSGFQHHSRALLIATGGLSYPATGSDGFGLAAARQFGHKIIPTSPALVPFLTDDVTTPKLTGLALRVRLTLWVGGKKNSEREGDFLFTHQGFSGPVVFDMSRAWLRSGEPRRITVDFAPHIKEEAIAAVLMDSAVRSGALARLSEIVPKRLTGALLEKTGIDGKKPASLLSRAERLSLLAAIKSFELPISGTLGYEKAEVTAGGVDLRELNGATLESKHQPGLFFCGEALDADGRVGGFNLHWAWASGVAAAQGIVKKLK